jgi:hypothetical protein
MPLTPCIIHSSRISVRDHYGAATHEVTQGAIRPLPSDKLTHATAR